MKRRPSLWLVLAAALCAAAVVAGVRGCGGREAAEDLGRTAAETGTPHVLVLNGADRAGLAREISLLLGPAGCVAAGVGNAPGPVRERSVLVNRRLARDRAERLARRLGGVPLLREWDRRTYEDAVLVLGADWRRVREALAAEAGDAPSAAN